MAICLTNHCWIRTRLIRLYDNIYVPIFCTGEWWRSLSTLRSCTPSLSTSSAPSRPATTPTVSEIGTKKEVCGVSETKQRYIRLRLFWHIMTPIVVFLLLCWWLESIPPPPEQLDRRGAAEHWTWFYLSYSQLLSYTVLWIRNDLFGSEFSYEFL